MKIDITYNMFLYISDDVVWYDVLLLYGEYVQGEPVYVQQLPENDGPLQPRRWTTPKIAGYLKGRCNTPW